MVAANPDPHHRGCGVRGDSNAWADAAIRSAWVAACGACVCGEKAVHLGVLAPDHYSDRVVVQKSWRGGDEHDGVRRAKWLGFGTAQGSSSRGGLRGLAVMARRLEEGVDCAFTIDGPRGPRYVAKPGPVMLARKTGCPIMVFHIGVERGKTFEKTWDHFLLPAPFSRTVILFAPPIYVPSDATAEAMEAKHAEMQRELERVRDIAEAWYSLSETERARHRTEFNR